MVYLLCADNEHSLFAWRCSNIHLLSVLIAMRNFLFKLILFLVLVSVSILAVELFVRYKIPNVYRFKNDWLRKNSSTVELLVLGNSHCYYGICPDYFPCKSYNAAIVSQTLQYDYFILQNYNFRSLKDVIINVDISNVFDPPLSEGEGYRCAYYSIYMNYPASFFDLNSQWEVMSPGALQRKISNYHKKGSECLMCSPLGFGVDYVLENRSDLALSDENANNRLAGLITDRWRENFDKNVLLLLKISNYCIKRNIRLTVLSTPLHQRLRNHVPFVIKEEISKTLQEFSQKGYFRYLDFSDDSSFNDDAFFDLDHLSDKGAFQLTKKIVSEMDNNY